MKLPMRALECVNPSRLQQVLARGVLRWAPLASLLMPALAEAHESPVPHTHPHGVGVTIITTLLVLGIVVALAFGISILSYAILGRSSRSSEKPVKPDPEG